MVRSVAAYRYYAGSVLTLLTRFHNPLRMVRLFLHRSRLEIQEISLRPSGPRYLVRSKMDIWSVKESAADRFYEHFGFLLESGWTIVDVGAALGEFAIYAATKFPDSQVLAFEPFPQSFDLLKQNISLNDIKNVAAYQKALSSEKGTLMLDVDGGEPLMMETGMQAEGDRVQLPVESITLAEVVASTNGGRIDFLKLDCEGAEYDILLKATPETLLCIDRIVMEYHDHLMDLKHPALVACLTDAGYAVEVFPNIVYPDVIGYLRAIRSTTP